MFSQKPELIGSVASDGLTNLQATGLTKYNTKRAKINLVEK